MELLKKDEATNYINLESKIRGIAGDILRLLETYGYFTSKVYFSGFHVSNLTLDVYYNMSDGDDDMCIPIPVEELESITRMDGYLRNITKQKQDYVWSYTGEDIKEKLRRSYMEMKHVSGTTGDTYLNKQAKQMENKYGVHNLQPDNNGTMVEGV